jgi:metal-responsive CopG/Arc/MetJ family transcriptional regulator
MATISISLDDQTKQELDSISKQLRTTRSDVIRDMFVRYRLQKKLEEIEASAGPVLRKLGLETEDDIAKYAKS